MRSPELAKLPRFKLPNGLQVFSISRPGAPMAQIRLGLQGGNASTQPVGAAGLAAALAQPKCLEAPGLNAVGGQVFAFTGLTQSDSSVTVLSGNLANGMAVLADRVRCREVDEEIFLYLPRMLDTRSKSFKRSEKRPEFIAGRKFLRASSTRTTPTARPTSPIPLPSRACAARTPRPSCRATSARKMARPSSTATSTPTRSRRWPRST